MPLSKTCLVARRMTWWGAPSKRWFIQPITPGCNAFSTSWGAFPARARRLNLRLRARTSVWRLLTAHGTNLRDVPTVGAVVVTLRATSEPQLTPRASWREVGAQAHFVQFYDSEEFLTSTVAAYVANGLATGDGCVVINTEAHARLLEAHIEAEGVDLATAREDGDYLWLDATATLAAFMVDGLPEPGRFARAVGAALEQAGRGWRHVRAFGEMVALLWAEGNADGAIRLEELWNAVNDAAHPFTLFCAYPMQGFASESDAARFGEICDHHSTVMPDERYSALGSPDERLRAITLMQQKASAFDAEVALRKALEAREEARATALALQQANARMDEFLGIASHELKTPVTALKANLQVMARRLNAGLSRPMGDTPDITYLAAAVQRGIAQSERSINRLMRIVDDLLDVSRISGGMLEIRCEPYDLRAVVREAVEEQRQIHPQRTLRLHLPEADALPVVGDADRTGQVIANYIANALKYSAEEQAVEVRVERRGTTAWLGVRDRGPGLTPEEQVHIWEPFVRAARVSVASGSAVGLGLGLHICKTMIERQGGAVGVESTLGEGSTFEFTLPLDTAWLPATNA